MSGRLGISREAAGGAIVASARLPFAGAEDKTGTEFHESRWHHYIAGPTTGIQCQTIDHDARNPGRCEAVTLRAGPRASASERAGHRVRDIYRPGAIGKASRREEPMPT